MSSSNLDLVPRSYGVGTRRLEFGGVGGPRDRNRGCRWALARRPDGVVGMAEGWRSFLSAWEDLQVKVDQADRLLGPRPCARRPRPHTGGGHL